MQQCPEGWYTLHDCFGKLNCKNVGPIRYSDNSKDVQDLLLLLFCSGCIIFTIRILKYGKKFFTPKIALSLSGLCDGSEGDQSSGLIALINITARDVVAFIEKTPCLTCFLNYCRKIMFVFLQMLRRENPNSHVLVTSIRRHLLVKL